MEKEFKILNSKDLQEMFGFGNTKMSQILNSNVLPVTKIGKQWFTTSEQMQDWFNRNAGKEISL